MARGHTAGTQSESDGVCLGMSPWQWSPEGGQMRGCREELGPSRQGRGAGGTPPIRVFSSMMVVCGCFPQERLR